MPNPEEQPNTNAIPEDALPGMPEALTPGEQAGETEQRFRTIAVRVQEDLHSRLAFLAQLKDSSLSEEIRQAIEERIAAAQEDPDVIARAQRVREEIEREAAARSAAIAGFMGSTALGGDSSTSAAPSRTRRGGTGGTAKA